MLHIITYFCNRCNTDMVPPLYQNETSRVVQEVPALSYQVLQHPTHSLTTLNTHTHSSLTKSNILFPFVKQTCFLALSLPVAPLPLLLRIIHTHTHSLERSCILNQSYNSGIHYFLKILRRKQKKIHTYTLPEIEKEQHPPNIKFNSKRPRPKRQGWLLPTGYTIAEENKQATRDFQSQRHIKNISLSPSHSLHIHAYRQDKSQRPGNTSQTNFFIITHFTLLLSPSRSHLSFSFFILHSHCFFPKHLHFEHRLSLCLPPPINGKYTQPYSSPKSHKIGFYKQTSRDRFNYITRQASHSKKYIKRRQI